MSVQYGIDSLIWFSNFKKGRCHSVDMLVSMRCRRYCMPYRRYAEAMSKPCRYHVDTLSTPTVSVNIAPYRRYVDTMSIPCRLSIGIEHRSQTCMDDKSILCRYHVNALSTDSFDVNTSSTWYRHSTDIESILY